MTFTKAEFAALVLLVAIGWSAGLVYETHRYLITASAAGTGLSLAGDRYVLLLFASTLGLLASAFLLGLFYMLPLVRAQSREHGKLHTLAEMLRRRSKAMERAALTDVLTGLNNRRFFDEVLKEYLAEFSRIGQPVGLMILDLDHFKSINDTYGHDVGDEVLRAVSRCLQELTRYHDVLARLGGEEFGIVVPNMGAGDLGAFADRVRAAVERLSVDVGNVRLRITVSVGLAVARSGEESAALYKRADVNLYAAKDAGRNRICA